MTRSVRAEYPAFRLVKHRLYRESFQSWDAYLLPSRPNTFCLYSPAGTHVFDSSGWSEAPYSWQTLVLPGESFVPHLWRRPDGYGFYIDVARQLVIQPGLALWEDLYLDVLITDGMVSEKDEDMLATLPPQEARHARKVRDEILRRVSAGDEVFDPSSEFWRFPRGLEQPLPRRGALAVRPTSGRA